MKHLGDITKIHGDQIEPVDVITFGSPCQDLSVAGKRAGLAGERSGLFMEAVRIIKEMRESTNGIYPNFAVWENVPGAFSSNKGEDFRAVLEELVRIQEPDTVIPKPPKGKWNTSGAIVGNRWSLAWRVLDAQFWGVPQRRRRIALVMDFAGQSAPEILFERNGMQRDSAPCGKARKRIARDIKKSVGGTECYPINLQIATRHKSLGKGTGFGVGDDGEPAYTLQTGHEHGVCAPTYCLQGSMIGRAESLRANMGDNQTAVVIENHPTDSRVKLSEDNKVQTLTSRMGTGGGNVPLIMNIVLEQKPDLRLTHCKIRYRVRRLTPLECERLQGYPDGWTNIPDYIDDKGKKKSASDSARYKALGNSIALPPWKWVLKRISAQFERDATLGSLFDGIGGFPLIWEQLNGKGSAKWASEIEPFPIAVTKHWFNCNAK